jgi:hypothetical protein
MTVETPWTVPMLAPEGCIVETRGVLIGLWLTALRREHFTEIRRALFDAHRRYPRGVSTIAIVRLDRRFPLQFGYEQESLREAFETLKAVRSVVTAGAGVVEFGGLEGLTLRAAVTALNAFVGSRPACAMFETVPDAFRWLIPYTPEARSPDSLAHYLRVVRSMRKALEDPDLDPTALNIER